MRVLLPQLSGRQASVYAATVFSATLVFRILLPGLYVALSGFLIVIFLSVFVQDKKSTVIAGLISSLVVLASMIWEVYLYHSFASLPQHLFILLLVLFTTLIVLYIKSLFIRMQFQKSHMTSLFENATEGIIFTNDKGEILLVNPAALRMFGYEAEELIGQLIEVLIPKKYRPGHVRLRNGFNQEPENRAMGVGRDLFGQKKNGENFAVEVSLSPYTQQENSYVIAFIIDITQRKDIEQNMLKQQKQLEKVTNDIRRLNAELEAKVEERTLILKDALQRLEQSQAELSEALDKERQLNEIKSRFVAMASHEFRTPLSAVLSSATLMSKYTTTEQQINRDKHISRIVESVKHLNDLLEDFLSLGKLDEGKVGTEFARFNLPEVVNDTIEDLKGLLKEGQHIEYQYTGDSMVESEKRLLKNILINLISNAIKFSDPDTEITVKSDVDTENACISVQDRGIGISEEDQRHLFSSFFRGMNALNIQGTGLGLHIVKRYSDLLGGSLNLQSQLHEGTTITLTFPIKQNNNGKDNSGN